MDCLGGLQYDSLMLSTSSLEDSEMDNPIMIQEYPQQFLSAGSFFAATSSKPPPRGVVAYRRWRMNQNARINKESCRRPLAGGS
ncbi:hypothetical protein SLEP1_g54258 [Rubroshorea leprosula]|uniref:Uncharacterized protein n=1 Tax=Rubroshorea leprosula TaxID=152421 RepID=A0AAV5MFV5_9ROSI|nr:hypothetical protein SLEP1_g54258 [Rubroshorea leprosula]